MPHARALAAFALLLAVAPPVRPQAEPVDLAMVTRIREEGLHRSRVMATLFELTDVLGPRLTASPQARAASEWARGQLAAWGLANAHSEPFAFGRGWSFRRAEVRMTAPREVPLAALPKAWTPGTDGPVRGPAILAVIEKPEDAAAWRGKLSGKIVLLDKPRTPEAEKEVQTEPERYAREDLDELGLFPIPEADPRPYRERSRERYRLQQAINELLTAEKALAAVSVSSRGYGILRVAGGGSWEPGGAVGVPGLVMASEAYGQIARLLDDGRKVELEIDVAARFHDDAEAANTIAEIPGTTDEVVMVGAHLDSWHAGTGATDDGAGCAVAMEAVRILEALGVRPRRTIRIALWMGEEQGLLGSRAYVAEHFATRPLADDPEQAKLPARVREERWPIAVKPEHAKLSAYFNLDNGSGRIRGVYAQENAAVRPIFAAWLEPFRDLGADTVTLQETGSTDHVSFDRVGLPGFQFIQDELDYGAHTHHTNLDVYDRAKREDLVQASVVLASFLYHAAMRPEPLPRKPMPQPPPERPTKTPAPAAHDGGR